MKLDKKLDVETDRSCTQSHMEEAAAGFPTMMVMTDFATMLRGHVVAWRENITGDDLSLA